MARMSVSGFEIQERRLDSLGRTMIRKIVEAGAAAAEKAMADETKAREHIRTGDMLESIGRNEYREGLWGGSVDVYPQGKDRFGVRNAEKAFVINYGRGRKKKGSRMGDKFITGNEEKTEEAVRAAMQAECDRLIEEV